MGGYEDPEMAEMRQLISGAVDAGFDEASRAKEGTLPSTGKAGYHVRARQAAAPQRPALCPERPASSSL